MSKQMIGCPRPNFPARIGQPLSLVLLALLSTQFDYSPNAQASGRMPSLVREARNRSVPDALAIKFKTVLVNTQEPTTLELGKPVERELSGGQEHSYQLALTDGQYASVVIEQRGIDVSVQLQETAGNA